MEAGRPFGDGTLQVFYCLSDEPECESDAEAFFPFSRAVLVHVLPPDVATRADPRADMFAAGLIVSWRVADDFPHPEDQERLGIDVSYEEFEALAETYPRAGDKLLGWPHWIQGAEYPNCRKCEGLMEYVFQIDSEDNVPHMFGDVGCGHVFQCGRHPEEMAFGWACS